MLQNYAKGKEGVRSVSAEQGCSHIELRIVGNSNKLVHLTSRITTFSSTRLHYIFIALLRKRSHALIQVHPVFRETPLKN